MKPSPDPYTVIEFHKDGSQKILYTTRRSGWWVLLKMSWDALWGRRPADNDKPPSRE